MRPRRLVSCVAVGLAMAWGFTWIAVGRSVEDPRSAATAVPAGAAAVTVLLATAWYHNRRKQDAARDR